jgi:hypothetical protein
MDIEDAEAIEILRKAAALAYKIHELCCQELGHEVGGLIPVTAAEGTMVYSALAHAYVVWCLGYSFSDEKIMNGIAKHLEPLRASAKLMSQEGGIPPAVKAELIRDYPEIAERIGLIKPGGEDSADVIQLFPKDKDETRH